MKTKVYNLLGKETGDIDLKDEVFAVEIKPEVVHQVFISLSNNQRQPWAHSKDKSEVRGGGKKPWKQKGTGRARHGSIRSPLWVGGGVTFGPLNLRNYKDKINKKMKKAAIKMCLSDKVTNEAFWVIDNFDFSEQKTKLFDKFLKDLPAKNKKYIVLTDGKDNKVLKMTNNLQQIKTVRAEDVNLMDLLNNQGVIITKEGVNKLEENLSK